VPRHSAFVVRLEKYFLDPDAKEKAREKLEHFRQEQKGIVEYITQLEALFHQAELKDDYEKQCLLEKGVKRNIVDTLYTLNNVKDKYDGLKADILVLGQSREHRAEQLKHKQPSYTRPHPTSLSSPSILQCPRPPPFHPPQSQERRTATGTIFGGQGKPMEIGKVKMPGFQGNCYNCGGFGYMGHNCDQPRKKFNVRAIFEQLNDDELDELKAFKDETLVSSSPISISVPPVDGEDPINTDFIDDP
jgi:hypothetical protein